ncbi:hypothetical protein [Pseudohoeflea coraliihabitans]|uniref:Uncharacterized protein n=1 Tax=Pseudohoeflea coraliihabitans TaxID=2860393 RepID=A0ABS6WTG4_9HYPH|nr:hypothetical protein [Pseudohoeflea sp. DP4N28-3]MBW3099251.1 hypothetical protein [Pseudohoeflea sp. DP4N28-3]
MTIENDIPAGDAPAEERAPVSEGNEAVETKTEAKTEAEAPAESRTPQVKPDMKRSSVYERARAAREKNDSFRAFASPEEERRVFGPKVETGYDRDEARQRSAEGEPEGNEGASGEDTASDQRAEAQVEAPAETRRRKLKVNKHEVEMDEEQVVKLAQQALAAGNILEQAKAYRDQLEQKLATLNQAGDANQSAGQGRDADPNDTSSKATTPGDDELDDIIDRIQVGDTSEAKAALMKFGDQIAQRIESKIGNIDERISATTRMNAENERRQNETRQVLEEFSKDHSEFVESKALTQALAQESLEQMRAHMHALGVRDETIESLRQKHGMQENEAISYSYRLLRDQGHQLPDHGSVLRQSAANIRKAFGISPSSNPPSGESGAAEQRLAEKRQMGSQPRRASIAPQSKPDPKTLEQTRLEAVRQARNFRRGGR